MTGRHRGRYEPKPFVNRLGATVLHLPKRQWWWSTSMQKSVFGLSTMIIDPHGGIHHYPALWHSRRTNQ